MDKVDHYRQIVRQVLIEYSRIKPANGEIEVTPIFDTEGDHYQIIHTGWDNRRRVYGCPIHIDIRGDKVWIQNDRTDVGIANELVERGILKQDIVLAYHAPYLRQFTEFAVG